MSKIVFQIDVKIFFFLHIRINYLNKKSYNISGKFKTTAIDKRDTQKSRKGYNWNGGEQKKTLQLWKIISINIKRMGNLRCGEFMVIGCTNRGFSDFDFFTLLFRKLIRFFQFRDFELFIYYMWIFPRVTFHENYYWKFDESWNFQSYKQIFKHLSIHNIQQFLKKRYFNQSLFIKNKFSIKHGSVL